MVRLLLIEARGDHVIFGRLLQGPTAVERLLDDELRGLLRIYERWKDGQ